MTTIVENKSHDGDTRVFIEPTPQHDEILAATYIEFGSKGDIVINNKARNNGELLPDTVPVFEYSFMQTAKAIANKDVKHIWFSTLETPEAAALFLFCLILRRRISFVAHHAELFGSVKELPERRPSLRRLLYGLCFGRFARRYGHAYVLSKEVADNCKYAVQVLDVGGLAKVLEGVRNIERIPDPSGRFVVGILGDINRRRRNYDCLLDLDPVWCRKVGLRFNLIGNMSIWDGPEFIEKLRALGLSDLFWWSDDKLSNERFVYEVSKLDLIFAPYATTDYGRTVTSASKVFALGLKKSILEGCEKYRLFDDDETLCAEGLSLFEGLKLALAQKIGGTGDAYA